MRLRGALNQAGFSLLEILIALFIMALAIVPMMTAFMTAMTATEGQARTLVYFHQANGTLSRLMAAEFAALAAHKGNPVDLSALWGSSEQAAKETFTYGSTAVTPSVAITDAGGGKGGLLEIVVTVDDLQLQTLRAQK